MKKAFVLLLSVLLFMQVFGQCPTQSTIELASQEELVQFVISYPDCTILEANLQIGTGDTTDYSNIFDISILSQLTQIQGNLLISANQNLESLDGLENITDVLTLEISYNPNLSNVSAITDINLNPAITDQFNDESSLWVIDNPLMDDCCFISDIVDCYDLLENLEIKGNGFNCSSLDDFIFNCYGINQSCTEGTSTTFLSANNVDAYLANIGGFLNNDSDVTYTVPAGSLTQSIYATSLWMGGIDEGGNLKVSTQTYRQYGNDFFAGPILEEPNEVCSEFDTIWNVKKQVVNNFINAFIESNGQLTESAIDSSILYYPARNNPFFNQFELPEDLALAPFVDTNNDGNYNPMNGDFPMVKGDENYWFVYNDTKIFDRNSFIEDFAPNGTCSSLPLGMEISTLAYASASDDYINNATFYDYTLRYKGETTLNDFYLGLHVDIDLGSWEDDYVGCLVEERVGYGYNRDGFDEGANGYGNELPVIATQFVKSLTDDNGEEVGLSSFIRYQNNFTDLGNPTNAEQSYNFFKGFWVDDTPITYGGDGYGGDTPFPYMYADLPSDPAGWSMVTTDFPAQDQRYFMAVGPISLEPGEEQTVTIGYLWFPDAGFAANVDLQPLINSAQALQNQDYEANFFAPCSGNILWYADNDGDGLGDPENFVYHCGQLDGYVLNADDDEDENELSVNTINIAKFSLNPNPCSDRVAISFHSNKRENIVVSVFNQKGESMLIENYQVSIGDNQIPINTQKYSRGVYSIQLKNADLLMTRKFVKM